MVNIVTKYFNHPFVRNVIIMVSGTAGAQIITMLISPLITRMYGPNAFGILGIFTAMTSIITPLVSLTYPIAIVLPEDDHDAKLIYYLSLIVSLFLAILSIIMLLFWGDAVINIFNIEKIASYMWYIPFIILITSFMQINEQWSIRKKQFTISAQASFAQAIIIQVGKVILGIKYPIAAILIFLTSFGDGIKALFLYLHFVKSDLSSKKRITYQDLKKTALMFSDFPKYRAPEVLLNAISQSLPTLLLATYFSPASVGFYTLTKSVLSMPTILIGKSLGDVFYPEVATAKINGANITNIILKSTLSLALIGLFPFGIVIIFGPQLFEFAFGNGWSQAGEYARWISIWSYFGFINIPSIKVLPILSAQSFHLFMTIIMLIARIVSLMLGYYIFSSDVISIALFSLSGAVLNLILILLTLKISKSQG